MSETIQLYDAQGRRFYLTSDERSYCQELCMQGSRGVLFYPDAILEAHAVHDLRQVMRGT